MPSEQQDPNQKVNHYGMWFSPLMAPIHIHMHMIQKGGQWIKSNGQLAGNGLYFHYSEFSKLLWPEEDDHRWWQLCLKTILESPITPILGPKDSGKTHCMAKFGLMDYWCFPHSTLILISSTDMRGLEYRIWGDLKGLYQRAKAKWDFLGGHLIDSKHAICTDNLQEEDVRDMRKGIVCIPCISSNGQFVGLGKYVGLKQKRRRLLSDECQFMRPAFLDSLANLNSGDFKGVFVGNPLGEGDPLDKISEPKEGWNSINEPDKTTTWENKFGGTSINLVGTDSPNFDFPQDEKPKYPYMIHQKEIKKVEDFYGRNSLQYYSQVLGIRKTGLYARRVITLTLCKQFDAMEKAVWFDTKQVKVYAVDAAYGSIGGDRCVGGVVEFGKGVDGKETILNVNQPVIIPISPRSDKVPEDQIAQFVKEDCERQGVPPENVFYDSTGRGSLGTAFARLWSPMVNPVEFGGSPTGRPVADLMIRDKESGHMRPKRADEHFSKFVTEIWFSVRYIIESWQMRNMPMEVIDDACSREWYMVRGDKIEIEPKEETRKRTNRSPDLMDWLATACEGARRLGFTISKLSTQSPKYDDRWKDDLKRRAVKLRENWVLS